MAGFRRPARQALAPPSQRGSALAISRYSLESLRVPGNAAANAFQDRTLSHVDGPVALAGGGLRLNLNTARGYMFRLRMPRDTTADRLGSTQVILSTGASVAAAMPTLLSTIGNEATDALDRVWAVGAADFGGAPVAYMTFRSAMSVASRANTPQRNYDSRYTFSACALTAWAWS